MSEPSRPQYLRYVLIVVLLAAVASLLLGIRHARIYMTHDMQWAGAHLTAQGIDPWQEYLEHNPHKLPHAGPPNYLYHLYLLLLPLGVLPFETASIVWTAGNVLLSLASVWLLKKLFRLDLTQAAFVLGLLWMSAPFRVVLEVGQMSFFELFFLTGAYLAVSEIIGGLSFGMSLAKYSFSPAAAILFLLRKRFLFLVVAAALPLIGLLVMHSLVHTPFSRLIGEPFAVSAAPTAVSPGFADLMTLLEHTLKHIMAPSRAQHISYLLGLLGSAAFAFLLSRYQLSRASEFTLISLASLFFVKHLIYDYVFLAVLLSFAFAHPVLKVKRLLVGGVLVFWFPLAFLDRWQSDRNVNLAILGLNCALLAALLVITTRTVLAESVSSHNQSAS